MPIIIAAIIAVGSFFGYVGIQSGVADKAYCGIEQSACKPPVTLDFQCRETVPSLFYGNIPGYEAK